MATLTELLKQENAADDDRRGVGAIPEVFREPGAAQKAYDRWLAAHQALTEAREADMEAGA